MFTDGHLALSLSLSLSPPLSVDLPLHTIVCTWEVGVRHNQANISERMEE
jgi:hypothetical protein